MFLFIYLLFLMINDSEADDNDDEDDAMEFRFGQRLLDRVVLYASFH